MTSRLCEAACLTKLTSFFCVSLSLDLPVHSLILNDLARNLASTSSHAAAIQGADSLAKTVQDGLDEGADVNDDERLVMVRPRSRSVDPADGVDARVRPLDPS